MARPSIRFFSFAFGPCPLSASRLTRLSLRPVRPASRTAGTYRPFGSAPSGVNTTPKYTPKSSSSTISILLRPTSLILIFVPILTGFLGVWQLKRLRWKLDLIEEVDRNLHKEPMLLPGNIKWVSSSSSSSGNEGVRYKLLTEFMLGSVWMPSRNLHLDAY